MALNKSYLLMGVALCALFAAAAAARHQDAKLSGAEGYGQRANPGYRGESKMEDKYDSYHAPHDYYEGKDAPYEHHYEHKDSYEHNTPHYEREDHSYDHKPEDHSYEHKPEDSYEHKHEDSYEKDDEYSGKKASHFTLQEFDRRPEEAAAPGTYKSSFRCAKDSDAPDACLNKDYYDSYGKENDDAGDFIQEVLADLNAAAVCTWAVDTAAECPHFVDGPCWCATMNCTISKAADDCGCPIKGGVHFIAEGYFREEKVESCEPVYDLGTTNQEEGRRHRRRLASADSANLILTNETLYDGTAEIFEGKIVHAATYGYGYDSYENGGYAKIHGKVQYVHSFYNAEFADKRATQKKAAAGKKAAADKAAADKVEADKRAAENKLKEQKLAADKAAADKKAAEDKAAADKKAQELKTAQDKIAAQKKADADKLAANKQAGLDKKPAPAVDAKKPAAAAPVDAKKPAPAADAKDSKKAPQVKKQDYEEDTYGYYELRRIVKGGSLHITLFEDEAY